MNNKKSTKRAFLSSLLSLMLCMAMLIGTTFAWFTDSVTSTGNIIKSGKLDAELNYTSSYDDAQADNWKDASKGAIFNYDLWEPGYVDVKYVQVANVGNLAFKYLLNIIPETIVADGEVNLADVIDVYITTDLSTEITRDSLATMTKVGTLSSLMEDPDGAARGILLPEGSEATSAEEVVGSIEMGIALKMQESAGNEYQDLSVGGGFKVELFATQYTFENDSFGKDYDAEAPKLEVNSAEALLAAFDTDGAEIVLTDDIDATAGDASGNAYGYTGDNDVTIDLNGHKLTTTTSNSIFRIKNEGTVDNTVTIKNGTLVTDNATYCSVIASGGANGAETTVNLDNVRIESNKVNTQTVKAFAGSTINMNNCVLVNKDGGGVEACGGTINITGANTHFEQSPTGATPYNANNVSVSNGGTLNVYDGEFKASWVSAIIMNSGGTMNIYGGTFSLINSTQKNVIDVGLASGKANNSVLNLYGGTFNGNIRLWDYNSSYSTIASIYDSAVINGEIINESNAATVKKYSTVETAEELLEAAAKADGAAVVIADDVEITLKDEEVKNTVVGQAAIINQGTLTIDGGKYDNGDTTNSSSAVIENTGVLNISDGEFGVDGDSGRAVSNIGGTVTITGGTFSAFDRNVHTSRAAYVFTSNGGTITIDEAVSVGAPNGVFYVDNGGKIIVNGGTFTKGAAANNYYLAYANGGTIELNGGTYKFENSNECIWPFYDSIDGLKYNTTSQIYLSDACEVNWDRNK